LEPKAEIPPQARLKGDVSVGKEERVKGLIGGPWLIDERCFTVTDICSEGLKRRTAQKGTDLCGIAALERFSDAPEGFHPLDIYPACRSVMVFASRFPGSALHAGTQSPYTFVRNMMVQKLDRIAFEFTDELEREGIPAVPIPSAEPYDVWDPERNHGKGILSLKHAGVCAGLGVMGKNTLLVNDHYGNMIWLGAVLLSVELEPDPMASYDACLKTCTKCMDACPQNALDGTTINQKRCRERSISCTEGGGWMLSCNLCRRVCPNHDGLEGSAS
jgi:epoxyqueuosine reductase QueG